MCPRRQTSGEAGARRCLSGEAGPKRCCLGTTPPSHRHRPAVAGRGGAHFYRNAYALVLNTGISGGLGLVFWFLAARYYDDADVGRGSAAISAMMLLAGLVAVNAAGTLNRFIPKAGRHTFAVVAWAHVLTAGIIAVLAVAFLATLDWWGPAFDLLRAATCGCGSASQRLPSA